MEEEDLELQVQHHLVETLLTLSSKKKNFIFFVHSSETKNVQNKWNTDAV
jgi:hypothetical protein